MEFQNKLKVKKQSLVSRVGEHQPVCCRVQNKMIDKWLHYCVVTGSNYIQTVQYTNNPKGRPNVCM